MTCIRAWLIFSLVFGIVIVTRENEISSNEKSLAIELKDRKPYVNILIGTPPKSYQLELGTSFTGIFIISKTACERKAASSSKNDHAYDDSKVKPENKKEHFQMVSLGGTVQGYVIEQVVQVTDINLPNQKVGIATEWPTFLDDPIIKNSFSGYFGISYFSKETDQMFASLFKDISKKHFGLYLNLEQGKGEMRLGGIDASKIEGGESSLKDVPAEPSDDGWVVNIDSITIGGTKLEQQNLKALVDLSTNMYFGKKEITNEINTALHTKPSDQSQELWLFQDCDSISNSPKIVMTINNEEYTLEPSDHIVKMESSFEINIPFMKTTQKYFLCLSGFMYNKNLLKFDLILGTPFLNKYYAVFDVENKIMRFSKRAP